MERPAVRQLLNNVQSGRIDCVVVYKVDRLSRSLLDFAVLFATTFWIFVCEFSPLWVWNS